MSRKAILKCLTEKENLLRVALAEQRTPNSYETLLQHIFLAEFQENLRKIKTLFTELPEQDWQTQFNEKFSTLATLRYNEIKNTCLSYTEKPNSLTNDLYNELFTLLYPQGSFYQRLQCLCPTIKNRLVPEIVKKDKEKKISAENTEIRLTREMLSEKALEKYSFSSIVLDEQQELLLGVDELIDWRKPFSAFQEILSGLELSYSALYEKLKHHNSEMLSLIQKVESFHQTLTPKKALERLSRYLQAGGRRITGNANQASLLAHQAVADFKIYLEGFPEERQCQILNFLQPTPSPEHALPSKAKLLQTIFGADQCVEELSGRINAGLHDNKNTPWLNEPPSLAMSEAEKAERIREIEEKDISFLREPIGFLSLKNLPKTYLAALHQLRFDSLDALAELFNALPAEYYAYLGDSWLTLVKGPRDLATLIVWLNPEQCRQMLMLARSKGQINQWITNARVFGFVLECLSPEQRSVVYEACQSQFTSWIQSASDFRLVLKYLSPEQLKAVCEAYQNELTTWIKSAFDFGNVLEYLSPEQRSVVYEACQSELTNWIQSASDFRDVLEHLSPEQRSIVYEACQSKISSWIQSASDFMFVLEYLSPEQRSIVYEACQSKISSWIQSASDFMFVLEYLSPEQRSIVYEACQSKISSWIQSASDFKLVLAHLSPEQRSVVYEACQSQFTSWIQSPLHFRNATEYLSPEQFKALCEAYQSELTTWIKSALDFGDVLEYLSPEQRSVVYEACQSKITSWIKRALDFGFVLEYLSPEQRSIVYEACQSKISSWIQSASDFKLVLAHLSPEQRSVVYEACQSKLTNWIQSASDFSLVLEYLSPEQCVDLCLLLQKKMRSFILTWGDLDAILINSMRFEPEKARVLAQGICSALKSGKRKNGRELLLLCQLSEFDESFFSAQEKEVLQGMANQYISHFLEATSRASSSTTLFFNPHSSAALRMRDLIQKLSELTNSNNAETLRLTFVENELPKLNPHHEEPALKRRKR